MTRHLECARCGEVLEPAIELGEEEIVSSMFYCSDECFVGWLEDQIQGSTA